MGVLLEIMMAWAERVDGGIWMGWGSGKQKNVSQGRKKGSTDAGARERGTRGHRPEACHRATYTSRETGSWRASSWLLSRHTRNWPQATTFTVPHQ